MAQRLSTIFRNVIFYETRRYKGHSHWQNIAKAKMANDSEKSVVIGRLMIRIRSAVQNNKMEMNPKYNKDLANVLEECASNNVPKDTVKRAMERLKSAPPAQIHHYSICGRNGVYLIAEYETANKSRTKNQITKLCAKLQDFGVLDTAPGRDREGFKETGLIRVFKDSNAAKAATTDKTASSNEIDAAAILSLEDAETLAIELECEDVRDVEAEGDTPATVEFVCPPENVNRVSSALRVRGYVVQSSDVEFIPYPAPIKTTFQMEQAVKTLYQKLEEVEGLQRVFDNIDWGDST